MPGLSKDLYKKLRAILMHCDEFQSDESLHSLFVIDALCPFEDGLPTANSTRIRVSLCVKYLLDKQTKDGKFALVALLEVLHREPDDLMYEELQVLKKEVEVELSTEHSQQFLHFENRILEKQHIHNYLKQGAYVQIHAPGGLGKTYLLREIQGELVREGWCTVWIDLASDKHQDCTADRFAFMETFIKAIWENKDDLIVLLNEKETLKRLGRKLADIQKVALFLDNADQATSALRTWLREEFFATMAQAENLYVLSSAQQILGEWQGNRAGRPSYAIGLSSFDDPKVIQKVVEDVVQRSGPPKIRQRIDNEPERWQAYLDVMLPGLMSLACGHPLALERLLKYALDDNGFFSPDFFTINHANLIDHCLSPIVDGRIFPHLDKSLQTAFRNLCVFRYVWPGLLHSLSSDTTLWPDFGVNSKLPLHWWMDLQATHLIHEVTSRQLYPISGAVRQVIALVLRQENPDLYQERNKYAWQVYKRLLGSTAAPLQRGAYLLEVFYHLIQEDALNAKEKAVAMLDAWEFLNDNFDNETDRISVVKEVHKWLGEDAELHRAMDNSLEPGAYEQWINRLSRFLEENTYV